MKLPTPVAATAMLVAAGSASAQGMPDSPGKERKHSSVKTREQVRDEVIQARRDGTAPYKRHGYPPGAETIRGNKELDEIRHPEDVAAYPPENPRY